MAYINTNAFKMCFVGQIIEVSGTYICCGCKATTPLNKGDMWRGRPECKCIFGSVTILEDENQ